MCRRSANLNGGPDFGDLGDDGRSLAEDERYWPTADLPITRTGEPCLPPKGPRLGGGPAHERLMLANLATSLFEHDQITTTEAKAKRLRPLAERLVTFAKRGDLHSPPGAHRRQGQGCRAPPLRGDRPGHAAASGRLHPDHEDRGPQGDNAPMAVIELVREPLSAKKATVKEAEAATKRAAKQAESAKAAEATKKVEEAEAAEGRTAPTEPQDTETTTPQDSRTPYIDGPEAPGGEPDDATDGGYGPGSAARTRTAPRRPGSRSRATPTR